MSDLTLNVLFEAYLESLEEIEPERLSTRRSHLRNIGKHLDLNEMANCLVHAIDDRIAAYKQAVPKRGSHAPAISTMRMALRWAYKEGLLAVTPELAESMDMPPIALFANWREYQQAPSVYKALLSEMKISQMAPDDLDESFFEKFLNEIPEKLVSWRAGWREFRTCWAAAAEEGLVPELDLPEAPSKRREAYRIDERRLPECLAAELAAIRNRLLGSDLAERRGAQPYDNSTVELLVGSLLRLTGYAVQHRGVNLERADSFAAILTLETGLALMHHVNDQWLEENQISAELRPGFGLGNYEVGLLRQFEALARVGLRDEALRAAFVEEIEYQSQKVRARREDAKEPGRLNDYFHVAVELAKRGIEGVGVGLGDIRRATLLRDALALALFATFGYRISVLTNLELDEHVRRGEKGEMFICIRKEATKPGLRDLVHEVPRELIPLIEFYLNDARRVLLKGHPDHKKLLVSSHDGGPLGQSAVYAMFVARTADVLGEVHNPHQVRKAWASDWARWTKGDYMTASSILDSSALTLQKNYAKICPEEQIDEFDEETRPDWEQAEGGAA
jgi:site-specific recombinase XerD